MPDQSWQNSPTSAGKAMKPQSATVAILFSVLMFLGALTVGTLHMIMFGVAGSNNDPSAATRFLWLGALLTVASAWGSVVLYRFPSRPMTTLRWIIVGQGAAAVIIGLIIWTRFWATP